MFTAIWRSTMVRSEDEKIYATKTNQTAGNTCSFFPVLFFTPNKNIRKQEVVKLIQHCFTAFDNINATSANQFPKYHNTHFHWCRRKSTLIESTMHPRTPTSPQIRPTYSRHFSDISARLPAFRLVVNSGSPFRLGRRITPSNMHFGHPRRHPNS